MKKEKNEDPEVIMKKGKNMFIAAIGLFILFFLVLIVGVVIQKMGIMNLTPMLLVIAFIGCGCPSLFLIFKSIPGLILLDVSKVQKKYEKKELYSICSVDIGSVQQKLMALNFEFDGEYYKKKKFSLLKDYVTYYIKLVDSCELDDTLNGEYNHFLEREYKNGNKCFILFTYLESVDSTIKNTLRKVGEASIIQERIDPNASETFLCIAVDQITGKGYFLDGEGKIPLYAHGCRLVKKIL